MQSKLINLSEIINNDVSCENKDHRLSYTNSFLKPISGQCSISNVFFGTFSEGIKMEHWPEIG